MHYTIIDMEKDPRCGQFAYFRAMQYPFASVTVEVDITDMMTARGSRPFFLSLLYAVVRAANAVPQLRRRILPDGRVAEYDWCAPSYTVMKPDGVYVYATVEGELGYEEFVAEGQRRQNGEEKGSFHEIRTALFEIIMPEVIVDVTVIGTAAESEQFCVTFGTRVKVGIQKICGVVVAAADLLLLEDGVK